jgi:hypothetical protein
MKVLLISLFAPSKHNFGGPSALAYYLAKERPSGIKIDLMYYKDRETKTICLKQIWPIFFPAPGK